MSEEFEKSRDLTNPKGPWEFDEHVTNVFEDMLGRSIPGFQDMRSLTTKIATHYAQDNTAIVDLGCSRGGALEPIIEILGDRNKYLGVEVSEPMRSAATERFSKFKDFDIIIEDLDLRESFPNVQASVILSILTLQFIPIEYRQRVLADAYASLSKGGAIVLVEKVLGQDAHSNNLLVNLYYDLKGKNGYTEEQINNKRVALEGVLVPVTAAWNVQFLENAGFKHVESFWRNLNFVGWIGVK